jgi:hypothetical protein
MLRIVTLVVDDCTVRLVDGDKVIAEHPRSWGRRQIFENPEHRAALLDERRAARNLKGRDSIPIAPPRHRAGRAASAPDRSARRTARTTGLRGSAVGPRIHR